MKYGTNDFEFSRCFYMNFIVFEHELKIMSYTST